MISHIPRRKGLALLVRDGYTWIPVAWFKDEEAAELFVRELEKIVKGDRT